MNSFYLIPRCRWFQDRLENFIPCASHIRRTLGSQNVEVLNSHSHMFNLYFMLNTKHRQTVSRQRWGRFPVQFQAAMKHKISYISLPLLLAPFCVHPPLIGLDKGRDSDGAANVPVYMCPRTRCCWNRVSANRWKRKRYSRHGATHPR
jgi:hypothetical protein